MEVQKALLKGLEPYHANRDLKLTPEQEASVVPEGELSNAQVNMIATAYTQAQAATLDPNPVYSEDGMCITCGLYNGHHNPDCPHYSQAEQQLTGQSEGIPF